MVFVYMWEKKYMPVMNVVMSSAGTCSPGRAFPKLICTFCSQISFYNLQYKFQLQIPFTSLIYALHLRILITKLVYVVSSLT